MTPFSIKKLAALLLAAPLLAACSAKPAAGHPDQWMSGQTAPPSNAAARPATVRSLLPGMPAPLVAGDLYAADRPGKLAPVVRHDRSLVYVPNLGSNTVSVIDPRTYKVLRTVPVGKGPQHVVPS